MYYIYEIKGVKIGCTNDIKRRMYHNARKHNVSQDDYIILETHTCIEEANRRELELIAEKGYVNSNGDSYIKMYSNSKKYQHLSTTKEVRKKAVANTDYKAISKKVAPQHHIPVKVFSCRVQRSGYKGGVREVVDKVYLSTYNSQKEAEIDLGLIRGSISNCLNRDDMLQVKGYTFEYA